jgi:hypothetical protein
MSVDIVYGSPLRDDYLLVREGDQYLIVHSDYLSQESAVIAKLTMPESDWSFEMLVETGIEMVKLLNKNKFYPALGM